MNNFYLAIAAMVMAGVTFAADSMTGVYEGKVEEAKGVRLQEGESCTVTVTSMEKLHALKLEINGMEPVTVDRHQLDAAMRGKTEAKVSNRIPGKGVERVEIKHQGGIFGRVKMLHRHLGVEAVVACGSLIKKQE